MPASFPTAIAISRTLHGYISAILAIRSLSGKPTIAASRTAINVVPPKTPAQQQVIFAVHIGTDLDVSDRFHCYVKGMPKLEAVTVPVRQLPRPSHSKL